MAPLKVDMSEFHWLLQVMDTMDSGLVVLDLDYNVVAWNFFMQSYSGIRTDTIMGKNLFSICRDLPESWLKSKLDVCSRINSRSFSSWEDRPYVFKFRNYTPVTHSLNMMYQNMVITPLTSPSGKVTHLSIIITDVTDIAKNKQLLNQSNEQLSRLSKIDGLTQLLNRASWEAELSTIYQTAKLNGKDTHSLVLLDIDHFKSVNDTYGHSIGDEVIRQLAKTIRSSIRDKDYAGRYGGEEFAVLLPDTTQDQAYFFAERLRKKIEKLIIPCEQGTLSFSSSLGIAEFNRNFESHTHWISAADSALYQSKENGRNQTTVYV